MIFCVKIRYGNLTLFLERFSKVGKEVKVKSDTSLEAHQAGAYSGFCSMKRLGVLLLPPPLDGMRVYHMLPSALSSLVPFMHLSGERHYKSKVYCLRTQYNVTGKGSNLDLSIWIYTH